MITYSDSCAGLDAEMLHGFFVGWKSVPSPEQHLQILQNSARVVVALDSETNRVVGFVTALTDGIQAAFIPLLEVLPEYQSQGIGSTLMRTMLAALRECPCIDLTCDAALQNFYARFGMMRSQGMILRKY